MNEKPRTTWDFGTEGVAVERFSDTQVIIYRIWRTGCGCPAMLGREIQDLAVAIDGPPEIGPCRVAERKGDKAVRWRPRRLPRAEAEAPRLIAVGRHALP